MKRLAALVVVLALSGCVVAASASTPRTPTPAPSGVLLQTVALPGEGYIAIARRLAPGATATQIQTLNIVLYARNAGRPLLDGTIVFYFAGDLPVVQSPASTEVPTSTSIPAPVTSVVPVPSATSVAPTPTVASSSPASSTSVPAIPSSSSTSTAPSTTTSTTPTTGTAPPIPSTVPGLPAGVTLRDADGGAAYFAKWSASFPSDPGFFPVGVWAETLAGSGDAAKYKALGVNTFANLWAGPTPAQLAQVKAAGMYSISDVGSSAKGLPTLKAGSSEAANMYFDEADGINVCADVPAWLGACKASSWGGTDPLSVISMSNAVRAADPSRPVYAQYTKPFAICAHIADTDCENYAKAGDIISFDHYCTTDPYDVAPVWCTFDDVTSARRWAGNAKPVWPFIEITQPFEQGVGGRGPSAAMVNAEVWNAVIGGARGVQYFNHDFSKGTGCNTQHALIDATYAACDATFRPIPASVKTLNNQIVMLAPVINAPFADGWASVQSGGVNSMVKWFDGHFYLFASSRASSSQTVKFKLKTGTTASSILDGRTLNVVAGVLGDTFADANAVHIYRIS